MGRVDGAHSFRFMAEGNMWLLELGASGIRVLADPWLVDNLIFWEQPWLFSGKNFILCFASSSDLPFSILLSSSLILCCSMYINNSNMVENYIFLPKMQKTNSFQLLKKKYGAQKTGLCV
jgi:hypothetical protein